MLRQDLRVLATLISLGWLAACGGGDESTPDQSAASQAGNATTPTAGSANPTPAAGTGAVLAGSGGTPNAAAGAPTLPGGAAASAGAGTATAGTATSGGMGGTGGTGTTTAGSSSGGTTTAGASTGNELWIAPDGNDTNPGTEAAPLKTFPALLTKVKAGTQLWVKSGTYSLAATIDVAFKYSGTQAAPVTLQAAAGARPVLDFTSQPRGDANRGINLVANYWNIKGLELKKAGDNCIAISGSYNTIEDVIVHECGDTGIQITAPSDQATDQTRAANNTVLNCDSWGNLDTATGGENADGFAAKLRIGPGNSFTGCRAWNNADDGWDLFAADDVVKIDNSWAFSNGKPLNGSTPQGDGNGFKLGGAPDGPGQGGAVHLVTDSFAFENKACGFVRNNNPQLPKLTACGAKGNGTAYCSLSVSGEVSMSLSAAAAITAKRNADGSLPKP